METGKTVILLNLQNLYESLYDALNQVNIHIWKECFTHILTHTSDIILILKLLTVLHGKRS